MKYVPLGYPVGLTPDPPTQRNSIYSWPAFEADSRSTSFSHHKNLGFRELKYVNFAFSSFSSSERIWGVNSWSASEIVPFWRLIPDTSLPRGVRTADERSWDPWPRIRKVKKLVDFLTFVGLSDFFGTFGGSGVGGSETPLRRLFWDFSGFQVFLGISKPMVCQTYGSHADRLSRKRWKPRKQRKRRRQVRQLQPRSWVLDERKSQKPRKWRKPRESGVRTTGCPKIGFRNYSIVPDLCGVMDSS